MQFHVSVEGSDLAEGTESAPFATISHAAQMARPGDEVVVHAGEYREWVAPRYGGLSDKRRITYRAAKGEHVVIKGSEQISDWVPESGGVWRTEVGNALFGSFNPFAEEVEGDWVVPDEQDAPRCHLGDVYLEGKSFREVHSHDAVFNPQRREAVRDHWTGQTVPIEDPEWTRRVWFAEVRPEETVIWANFGDADPTKELVEINVRRSVFFPTRVGVDYITVRGFEMAQAATPWSPPTADQPGLIGPNWAKGWIIEDNIIHDAKCSAISLGKEASTGHNFFTERRDKPGYQYQLESVFSARSAGWTKERIGSHVVRNNTIYDCGQNGVVGHLGAVFSEISGNHIFNIAVKREFFGHEIAGIKLHAAIDTQIHDNLIERCTLGIWLDWETQGTRVSRNVLFDNCRDLFVEVSHGPYVVDHNILGSPASVESITQGGAYVGNLIAGTVRVDPVMDRATPYHQPHSTDVKGYGVIFGADDRWWGNILIGNGGEAQDVRKAYDQPLTFESFTKVGYGLAVYDGHPASLEAYLESVKALLPGDHDIFPGLKQPAYLHHNVYLHRAAVCETEAHGLESNMDPEVRLELLENGTVQLSLALPESFATHMVPIATTSDLERVRLADLEFENPDGTALVLNTDLLGQIREGEGVAGPIQSIGTGQTSLVVWQPGQ